VKSRWLSPIVADTRNRTRIKYYARTQRARARARALIGSVQMDRPLAFSRRGLRRDVLFMLASILDHAQKIRVIRLCFHESQLSI